MESAIEQFWSMVLPAIATALGIVITWGLTQLRRMLKSKTDSETATQAFDVIAQLIQSSVVSLNQTFQRSMQDGKLNDQEKGAIKHMAIAMVMNQLPEATKKVASLYVNDLEQYVDNNIEMAVSYDKRGNP